MLVDVLRWGCCDGRFPLQRIFVELTEVDFFLIF